MAFEATKRELGELYTFFRLLADGKVFPGTPDAQRDDRKYWPVANWISQNDMYNGRSQLVFASISSIISSLLYSIRLPFREILM